MVTGSIFYFLYLKNHVLIKDGAKEIQIKKVTHGPCLEENEYADYPINEKYAKEIKAPLNPLVISIRDADTRQEKFKFQIDGINPDHYHPLELHKCGVYATREFNFDPKTRRSTPNHHIELWKYDYSGRKKKVLLFSETDATGKYKSYFNDDFRIDTQEKYLVLEKSYLGQEEYALVIKDLNTKQDLLVLNLKDILAKYPDIIPGSFELGKWSEDGRYLQGMLFQGALDTAYYRTEAETGKTDIFSAPPDILAGVERAINFNNLHLAYVDIPTFTGIQEVYEQIIEQAKKEGKQKNLYLYNLATKEKVKIASAEPEWRFNIEWLSDSELQYELPSGEKKIYMIK